jgi:hypothetical protein
MQGVGTWVVIAWIQRCFCMDIQIFEKDSTRVDITHNWIGHYYVVSNLTYSIYRGGYIFVTHSSNTQEKW